MAALHAVRIALLLAVATAAASALHVSPLFSPAGCDMVVTRADASDRFIRFFNILDADRDDALTQNELAAFVAHLGDDHIEMDGIAASIAAVDRDGNGVVSFEEFATSFCRMALAREGPEPEQVHVAMTTDPSCVVIIWVTFTSTNTSEVQYGTQSGAYNNKATGIEYTYNVGVTGWDGFLHKVRVCGLAPETYYYYRVGAGDYFSKEFNFHTAPVPGAPSRPMRYVLFGDMGTFMPFGMFVTEGIANWHANQEPFDMTLHLGDISYAGTGSEREWEIVWDIYGRQTEVFAAYYPYMTTMGNHEKYYNFTAYKARYEMPGNETGGVDNFYFSFDYGLVHFVSLCSEAYAHEFAEGSAQWEWARKDLAAAVANRHNVPWIVVSIHRPMYGTSNTGSWENIRQAYEPMLLEFKVDLFLAGHVHVYERTLPMYDNQVVNDYEDRSLYVSPQAPVHLTIGTAGAAIVDRWVSEPDWLAFRQRSYGFGYMTVHNASALTFNFVSNAAEGIADTFTIVK